MNPNDRLPVGVTKFDLETYSDIQVLPAEGMQVLSGAWTLLAITHEERTVVSSRDEFRPDFSVAAVNGHHPLVRETMSTPYVVRVALFVVGRKRGDTVSDLEEQLQDLRIQVEAERAEAAVQAETLKTEQAARKMARKEHAETLQKHERLLAAYNQQVAEVNQLQADHDALRKKLEQYEEPIVPLVEPQHPMLNDVGGGPKRV